MAAEMRRTRSSSRRDIIGSVGGVGASKKSTVNDALTYLIQVHDIFEHQTEKYAIFLEIFKDFKAQRTDPEGVIARVKELFKGHPNLVLGFNAFLPKGFEINSEELEPEMALLLANETAKLEEAASFIKKIKLHFKDGQVLLTFLNIIDSYRRGHKNLDETYQEVASLLDCCPDLVDDFKSFFPVGLVQSPTQKLVKSSFSPTQLRTIFSKVIV